MIDPFLHASSVVVEQVYCGITLHRKAHACERMSEVVIVRSVVQLKHCTHPPKKEYCVNVSFLVSVLFKLKEKRTIEEPRVWEFLSWLSGDKPT